MGKLLSLPGPRLPHLWRTGLTTGLSVFLPGLFQNMVPGITKKNFLLKKKKFKYKKKNSKPYFKNIKEGYSLKALPDISRAKGRGRSKDNLEQLWSLSRTLSLAFGPDEQNVFVWLLIPVQLPTGRTSSQEEGASLGIEPWSKSCLKPMLSTCGFPDTGGNKSLLWVWVGCSVSSTWKLPTETELDIKV